MAAPSDYSLDVAVNGTGSVSSAPPGINCPGDCTETYEGGTQVTLTATPAPGWTFDGWSGACSGTGNCVLTMDADKAATATFTQQTSPLSLVNPPDGQQYTACFYLSLPTFQWETAQTFKRIEIQFSPQSDFSTISMKVKGKAAVQQLLLNARLWKKLLLLPGSQGGTIYWKVVGTKADKTREESDVFALEIGSPEPVGSPSISPTSKSSLPTLSWQNNCGTKFKAWFGNDPDFAKPGMKKKALSFKDADPNDNGGVFARGLTSGQWKSIRKLVKDVSGSTLYWYVESWDGVKRHSRTGVMSFVLGD